MQSEILLLKQLYIFRYLTQGQMVELLELGGNAYVSRMLKSLEHQGLIEKQKSKSVVEPAIYSLSKYAPKTLKDHAKELDLDLPLARVITNLRPTTAEFKQHCHDVITAYLCIRKQSKARGCIMQWLSKTQLYGFEPLPAPTPHALITLTIESKVNHYFLEVLTERYPRNQIFRRLKQYRDFWNSAEWEAGVESDCPKLLVLTQSYKQKIQAEKLLEVIDEDFVEHCIIQVKDEIHL